MTLLFNPFFFLFIIFETFASESYISSPTFDFPFLKLFKVQFFKFL